MTAQLVPSLYSLTLQLPSIMWSAHWVASLGKLDAETCLHAELPVDSKESHCPEDTWEQDPLEHVQSWNTDYLDICGRSAAAFHQWNSGFTLGSCFVAGVSVTVHLVQCDISRDSHLSSTAGSLTFIYPSSCCAMRPLAIKAWWILVQGKCVLTGDNVGCPLHLQFADLPLMGTFTVWHAEV